METKRALLMAEIANTNVHQVRKAVGLTQKDTVFTHWSAYRYMQKAVAGGLWVLPGHKDINGRD